MSAVKDWLHESAPHRRGRIVERALLGADRVTHLPPEINVRELPNFVFMLTTNHSGYYSNTSSSMLVTRPIRGSRRGRPRGSRRGGLTRASTTANTITVNLTNSDLGLEPLPTETSAPRPPGLPVKRGPGRPRLRPVGGPAHQGARGPSRPRKAPRPLPVPLRSSSGDKTSRPFGFYTQQGPGPAAAHNPGPASD
uniref:Uncharacterized protein n=1 Tax=Timema cristinae TaxID=61476 RepID=A0A7R9D136_TIMCR|nr:unnamed protein product [Timema cristinae]